MIGASSGICCHQMRHDRSLCFQRTKSRADCGRAHRHRMLDCGAGAELATWLPGARLNIAACALSGPGGRAAITWADEVSPAALRHVSLGDLRLRCFSVAAALLARGLAPGDWHSFFCV